jgi:hypothetical protein
MAAKAFRSFRLNVTALHALHVLERFPIVHSTAVVVLLSPGGTHGAVLDGFAHARAGGL